MYSERVYVLFLGIWLSVSHIICQTCTQWSLDDSVSSVTITSPNYPSVYPGGLDECWVIGSSHSGKPRVKVITVAFHLEEQSSCQWDWLAVRDGDTSGDELIGQYCGTQLEGSAGEHIVSSGSRLYLELSTDSTNHFYTGFELVLTATDEEPTLKGGLSTGVIIGIVFASVLFMVIITTVVISCIKSKHGAKSRRIGANQRGATERMRNAFNRITVIPRRSAPNPANQSSIQGNAPLPAVSFVNVDSSPRTTHYHGESAETTSGFLTPSGPPCFLPPSYSSCGMREDDVGLYDQIGYSVPAEPPPPYIVKNKTSMPAPSVEASNPDQK